MNDIWTLAEDRELKESGRAPLGRSTNSIKSRRAHLVNPTHSACIRYWYWLGVETLPTSLRPQPSLQSLKRDRQDAPVANSTLAAGQQLAIDAALECGHAFITGGAGTGKSFVAGHVAAQCRGTHRGEGEVALCALTGIAALTLGNGASLRARARARAIRVHTLDVKRLLTRRSRAPPPLPCVRAGDRATTLHAFAGIGLGVGSIVELLAHVRKDSRAVARWLTFKVLVIDEVSMLSAELFDALNAIAKALRSSDQPFGGIKLILVGDLLQLPPIQKPGERTVRFVFESAAWASCKPRSVLLETVARQDEASFAQLLEELRRGVVTPKTLKVLGDRCTPKPPPDFDESTHLYCHRSAVDSYNDSKLASLSTPAITFSAGDIYSCAEEHKSRLLTDMDGMVKNTLILKVQARVMLGVPLPGRKLANGSMGYVQRIQCELVEVRFDNGATVELEPHTFAVGETGCMLTRTAMPLTLAWAITVHKSQSLTLARACVRVDEAWAPGQVYVAISRVSSLQGLWLLGEIENLAKPPKNSKSRRAGAVVAHADVLNFYLTKGLLRALI